jgi:TetR/AcrR family transcriptional regulator, transcriptional repressor for nem operon
MARDGRPTREKILSESKALVLENGFAGTSVDQILARTQITKGAFFYHFRSKADLAKTLIEEFWEADRKELEHALAATEHLANNPMERLLGFVQHFIDALDELTAPYPGCLYASYSYEPNQFSEDIRATIAEAILAWRQSMVEMIDKAVQQTGTSTQIDKESLADHFIVILEGAYIVSKALNQAAITANQLRHYKAYLQMLLLPK